MNMRGQGNARICHPPETNPEGPPDWHRKNQIHN
jgi:hypothetical protein